MAGALTPSAFSRISQLASLPRVHSAFQWLHLHEQTIMQWQQELVSIPAPPFGECQRAQWMAGRFRELGLDQVTLDAKGNVLGALPADASAARPALVVLSAHLDTVFPPDTPIDPVLEDGRLTAPGACDNGAGLAGMLAIIAAFRHSGLTPQNDLLFVANVGEEGDGDLRGIRHLYDQAQLSGRIAAHIVLDGAGSEVAVTQALGSRRYLVTLQGPGGHSWTDAQVPNPIIVLSRAIAAFSRVALPATPRTTLSVGTIEGGSAVNAIPERAQARFDLRSVAAEQILLLEVALHRAVEDAVLEANALIPESANGIAPGIATGRPPARLDKALQFRIERIGDRPAGSLAEDAPLLDALRAVDRHLQIRTERRVASTDANIPLSLGVPALSMGAGGEGGGIHTRGEWYSAANRELALKRILLLLLTAGGETA